LTEETNPFLRRVLKRTWGRGAESLLARRLSGRRVPGSGNQDHSKADVVAGSYVIEAKSTVAASMSVKLSWLEKVTKEAAMTGRRPALSVMFVRSDGRPKPHGRWVMVEEHVFDEFCN